MARKPHRERFALRLEVLESRVLLSGEGPGRRLSRLAAWGMRADRPRTGAAEIGDRRAGPDPGAGGTVAVRGAGRIAAAFVPNDPLFGLLWGLDDARNVDIDAPEAWSVTTGSPATIVAVLDTGIDLGHPELAGRVWTNPGEVAANGVDDDGNGYVDDLHGWNFVSGTNDVQDDNGHGSHVSGTIAAAGNDGAGVVGVAWNATILPLKILAADGGGEVDAAIAAIGYAVREGARVINASWTMDSFSPAAGRRHPRRRGPRRGLRQRGGQRRGEQRQDPRQPGPPLEPDHGRRDRPGGEAGRLLELREEVRRPGRARGGDLEHGARRIRFLLGDIDGDPARLGRRRPPVEPPSRVHRGATGRTRPGDDQVSGEPEEQDEDRGHGRRRVRPGRCRLPDRPGRPVSRSGSRSVTGAGRSSFG